MCCLYREPVATQDYSYNCIYKEVPYFKSYMHPSLKWSLNTVEICEEYYFVGAPNIVKSKTFIILGQCNLWNFTKTSTSAI